MSINFGVQIASMSYTTVNSILMYILLSHIILRNFATIMKELFEHTNEECVKSIKSAKDALYVLNGK